MEKTAKKIVEILKKHGYIAVLAGGYVRDKLLGIAHKDIDIATNATPEVVESLFSKTISVGKSFGVVVVVLNNMEFDVATFRIEKNYEDGRHPKSVKFTNMEEDAKRRDFTVNSLFYDPIEDKIMDFNGGKEDLKKGIIKFVGNPYDRIKSKEDGDRLRMLRAIRFVTNYNFKLEDKSLKAIVDCADEINLVSNERIVDELTKIITGKNPDKAIDLLHRTGLLNKILKCVSVLEKVEQGKKYHPEGNVFIHTKLTIKNTYPDSVLRFAALLHDIGKISTSVKRSDGRITAYGHEKVGAKITYDVLRNFNCSNKFIAQVTYLVKDHMRLFQVMKMKKSKLKRMFRDPLFGKLLDLHKADLLGSNGNLETYNYALNKYNQFLKEEELSPALFITGSVLIELGYTPSKRFKKMIIDAENRQLDGSITCVEEAKDYIVSKYKK